MVAIFYPAIDAMLIGDTVARKILSKKLAPDAELEAFATLEGGWPDGLHVDSTGQLWNAVWGGKRIDVYATPTSSAQSITVPVSQPTSVLLTNQADPLVIVTSASQGLQTPAELDGHTIAARLSQL
ncbi:SMP-30/gluconolactonase/LRE family protein [Arthrobacter psychrolactophilus]